jgi:hypothetical protein
MYAKVKNADGVHCMPEPSNCVQLYAKRNKTNDSILCERESHVTGVSATALSSW